MAKRSDVPHVAEWSSKIDLTMNFYTDPKLLDVHGAIESLPALPLDGTPQREAATGTHDADSLRAPTLAPSSDNRCVSSQKLTTGTNNAYGERRFEGRDVSGCGDNKKSRRQQLTTARMEWAVLGLNQRPPRCQQVGCQS